LHLRIVNQMRWTANERASAYEQMISLHRAFDQIALAIAQLRTIPGFDRGELRNFQMSVEESRTTLLHYVTEVISQAESDRAAIAQRRRSGLKA
jgi:hypothetical protein